jgi:hypothetical protein
MEDNEKENHQLCPLYPSTLQSMCRIKRDLHFINYLLLLFVLENAPIDMSLDWKWTDIEEHVKHVQTGRNRHRHISTEIRQTRAVQNNLNCINKNKQYTAVMTSRHEFFMSEVLASSLVRFLLLTVSQILQLFK